MSRVSDAANLYASGSNTNVVVRYIRILVSEIGKVMDTDVIAARSVTLLIRNDPKNTLLTVYGTKDYTDQSCYIMK